MQIRNLWTHTSTALEGNTLSLGETDFILSEGLTVAGKPLKDHHEVIGHARAIDLIYALLDRDRLAVQDLYNLHAAVLTEVVVDMLSPVGVWKRQPNSTNAIGPDGRQTIIEFPAPDRVPVLMQCGLGDSTHCDRRRKKRRPRRTRARTWSLSRYILSSTGTEGWRGWWPTSRYCARAFPRS